MTEEGVSTVVFGVICALLALLGLFIWARAEDLPMALFGGSLLFFGVLFDFWLIDRHFDAQS